MAFSIMHMSRRTLMKRQSGSDDTVRAGVGAQHVNAGAVEQPMALVVDRHGQALDPLQRRVGGRRMHAAPQVGGGDQSGDVTAGRDRTKLATRSASGADAQRVDDARPWRVERPEPGLETLTPGAQLDGGGKRDARVERRIEQREAIVMGLAMRHLGVLHPRDDIVSEAGRQVADDLRDDRRGRRRVWQARVGIATRRRQPLGRLARLDVDVGDRHEADLVHRIERGEPTPGLRQYDIAVEQRDRHADEIRFDECRETVASVGQSQPVVHRRRHGERSACRAVAQLANGQGARRRGATVAADAEILNRRFRRRARQFGLGLAAVEHLPRLL
jgi:hypothetical protein